MRPPEARVPDVPDVAPELLERHDERRAATAEAIGSLEAVPGRLFVALQWRRLVEALSSPFVVDDHGGWAPRRRFLSTVQRRRVAGGEVGLRHVDARLELWRRGALDQLVGADTLTALHACVESADPEQKETNPGLMRLGPTEFENPDDPFQPPPSEWCASLVSDVVLIANEPSISVPVRAAWTIAALLTIHPFVDGNGRSCRLMHQLIASSSPHGFDWGTLEEFALRRVDYISALRATQPGIVRYDGNSLTMAPFVDFTLRSSIERELVTWRRVQQLRNWWEAPFESVDDDHRLIELAVAVWGTARLDELAAEIVADPAATAAVDRLVDSGRLCWTSGGFVELASGHPLRAR